VKGYVLFVDTETTGFPADWRKSYQDDAQWPYTAQLAWVVYDAEGTYIKGENHFLQIPAGSMTAASQAIHGISPAFLEEQGEPPAKVLKRLAADLKIYQPLVVGHFVRLDFHMLGVDFARAGLPNPLTRLHTFCTMQALPPVRMGDELRFQRLPELYQRLFHEPMERAHDAWADAGATAKAFFELYRTGEIDDAAIDQFPQLTVPARRTLRSRLILPLALIVLGILTYLVVSWIYG